jgi:hypothetical protein
MNSTKWVRATLWMSFPFNLIAAYMLAVPASALGQFIGFPVSVPLIYSILLSFMVAAFGFVYAWLAMQPQIDRPLLTVSSIGKSGVFVILLVLWLTGNAPGRGVFLASGDLAFATLWFWWLLTSSTNPSPHHTEGGGSRS